MPGADVRRRLLAGDASPRKDNGDMVKTIAIAVCSAVAYLAIIVGLTVYCSIRLIRAAALRKHPLRDAAVHGQSPLSLTAPIVLEVPHSSLEVVPTALATF